MGSQKMKGSWYERYGGIRESIFGMFGKLRIAAISLMSVRLSACTIGLMNAYEIRYFWGFRKSIEKIKVLLKSDESSGTLHDALC
jgi:hypothetical protein